MSMASKPNATFFDFLTLQLLNTSQNQIKMIAWPNGVLRTIALQSPLGNSITLGDTFEVYMECTGTCAATYVGIHIVYQANLTRVGFYNETAAWNGSKVVDVTTSVPSNYQNTTSEIKVLADTRNSLSTFYYDMWHLPERILEKNVTVQ